MEPPDTIRRRSPEGVDGLVVVSDREEAHTSLSQTPEHVKVTGVEILVFIDDKKPEV
jgi:hypothetical protein